MSRISVKDAVKRYGNNTVIPDLNLEIGDGELFTLLGPSGCGKTTLLRMIAGFNSIEGGDIFFNEKRINDMDPSKRNIGMVFQNYAIFPNLSVRDNVAFGLKNRKVDKAEIKKRTDEFLNLMQIMQYADRMPNQLSGGQQQRIALARALVISPDVLLMDEPLSNLDAKLRVEMRSVIRHTQKSVGITTVYVTHDQEEALTGDSSDEERSTAKQRLVSGEIRFIFVVDIYNEGVDIPEVNTVLFLRPTESLTVFLQQLGRGLRLAENKECLTVLDFIGQANKKYNFEEKFAALLSNTTHSVSREIKEGFVSAPKGCYIQLEKIAAKYVLDNISASYDRTSGLVARAASFTEDTGLPLTLGNFFDYYHLDPRAIYSKKLCFARLCVRAGVVDDFAEPLEETLTKAFARFAVVDSRRWIRFLLDLLPKLDNTDFADLPPVEQRMLQMFYVTVWGKAAEDWNREDVLDDLYALSDSPILLGELQTLLQYQYDRIDFIDEPVDVGFDCPLDLHCTYTRDQLLVALDFLKPSTVREGVKWLPEKQLDVFFVTLNKADKDYSPTTMYNDYSINENLFHWQSQSTTAENSATGQRYIHHREKGSRVLLFVREFKADSRFGGAAAYTYLGTVNYVRHEGSRPMNITWKLDRPIPARFLKKTNKLIVG